MKKRDYLKELKGLSPEGLKERIASLQEEKMKLRFRKASSQLNEKHRLRELRVQVAQAKTVLANAAVAKGAAA
ncbi:MAG: 50S ribosomal protein L29 [Bdellovibrionales bacterium]|nr:50S ribosomal protein L29 [Bdellovibrionales bacterium]